MTDAHAKKILIVEDEASAALALSDRLARENFTVLKAVDGEEGLQMALKEHPDLILADLRMAKMTGLEMIDELRKDAWGKTAKILIMTNVFDAASIEEAARYHALEYLIKGDNTLENMLAKIHAFFDGKA